MSFIINLIMFALSLTGVFVFLLLLLKQHVPAQSLMYIDNDIPKFWYLDRHSLDIYEPGSSQITRDVLHNFANGILNHPPNDQGDQGDVTLFIIKTDRLLNGTVSFNDVNLVHSTGIHKVFRIQKELPQAR
jgi:hypothetical protein